MLSKENQRHIYYMAFHIYVDEHSDTCIRCCVFSSYSVSVDFQMIFFKIMKPSLCIYLSSHISAYEFLPNGMYIAHPAPKLSSLP